MTRSPYAKRLFPAPVLLAVVIAVLSMWPARPVGGAKPEGATCRTNQQCSSGLCVKFTSPVGTCRLPTARWHNGEVITFGQVDWGATEGSVWALMLANYDVLYASTFGELEVGIPGAGGFSIVFRSILDVFAYLPALGEPGALTHDRVDPPSADAGGSFGGDVTVLKLNVDFSDAGLTVGAAGLAFGDLTLCNFTTLPGLNGLPIRQFLSIVSALLGGAAGDFSIADLAPITAELNNSFIIGRVSSFAQDHLVSGGCP